MIIESKPLTMSEVKELAGNTDKEEEVKAFLNKFKPLPVDKAKEMRKELEELELVKLKDMDIVNIVDLVPKDASDLNKIINDVSLDQEEITKVLDVVKKY